MTREAFIRKWLDNWDYNSNTRNEMREDLDKVIEYANSLSNLKHWSSIDGNIKYMRNLNKEK